MNDMNWTGGLEAARGSFITFLPRLLWAIAIPVFGNLLVLQFAFGVFGQNPVSDMLSRAIGFLPNLFAAVVIVIALSRIAAAIKDVLPAALAGLGYGKIVANLAALMIVAAGLFAALSPIDIAPAIANRLFYTLMVALAGYAIAAIGGGGIAPMRTRWEKWVGRIEQASNRERRTGANGWNKIPDRARERAEAWKQERQISARPGGEQRSFPQ